MKIANNPRVSILDSKIFFLFIICTSRILGPVTILKALHRQDRYQQQSDQSQARILLICIFHVNLGL